MAQLTIYLDEKTLRKVRNAAKLGQLSVSQWARKKLISAIEKDWPEDYFSVFGSLKDTDIDRPPQPAWNTHTDQERL
jgi:hypothetical protein